MKKIILDRLNSLKSELRELTQPKMGKRGMDEHKVMVLIARIDELKRLLR